jgi:prefoldin subunit 5
MEIKKVHWENSADKVRFTLPLTKVNEELRQVSGFASLDNPDEHDDVVTADASQRAFSRFRGNIREMHQPIAVGKMVDFREDEYFDPKTEETYKGIYVTVKVSKGAQDTWEKVLDGTLTGFSIGGHIVDAESLVVKSGNSNKNIRLIKEYDLEELSLVDNPANQLANVFSIQKNKDGDVTGVEGIMVEKSSQIVFWCREDSIAKTTSEDSYNCPKCELPMAEAGWFEYSDEKEKVSKTADCLKEFEKTLVAEGGDTEGGVEMSKVTKSVVNPDDVSSDIPVAEQGKAQTEVDSSVEEVAADADESAVEEPVSEVEEEANEISKMMDDLKATLEDGLQKNLGEVNKKIESINKSFDEFGEKIKERVEELDSRYNELSKGIAGIKAEVDSVEKSLRKIEAGTAIKKSGDLGGSSEEVINNGDDNVWRGAFLGTDFLN